MVDIGGVWVDAQSVLCVHVAAAPLYGMKVAVRFSGGECVYVPGEVADVAAQINAAKAADKGEGR